MINQSENFTNNSFPERNINPKNIRYMSTTFRLKYFEIKSFFLRKPTNDIFVSENIDHNKLVFYIKNGKVIYECFQFNSVQGITLMKCTFVLTSLAAFNNFKLLKTSRETDLLFFFFITRTVYLAGGQRVLKPKEGKLVNYNLIGRILSIQM